jgi:hypothetical protein
MKKVLGMRTVSLRLVAVALSIAVLTTACGSGADSSEDGSGADSSEDGSGADSSESDSGADSSESDSGADSSENARGFCDIAREQDDSADGFDPLGLSPADIEAFFVHQRDLIAEGIEAAPNDAIKADLQTSARAQAEVAKIFDAVDWDIFAVDGIAMDELFERPEVVDAGDRLAAYGVAECGIPDDDDDDDDGDGDGDDGDEFDFEAGSPELLDAMLNSPALRQLMIDDLAANFGISDDQANCFLDNLVDEGLFSATGEQEPDAAEMLAMAGVFADCGIPPEVFE